MKSAYVCGPLTELVAGEKELVKKFYERIADACQVVLGTRAFVPHEHYDPQKHSNFTPQQVDEAERDQVCNNTSVLIVAALAPSWGGGIEVEMAHQNGVPMIILCEREKLQKRLIYRLLRENPSVIEVIDFESQCEAIAKLKIALLSLERDKFLV